MTEPDAIPLEVNIEPWDATDATNQDALMAFVFKVLGHLSAGKVPLFTLPSTEPGRAVVVFVPRWATEPGRFTGAELLPVEEDANED